MAGPTLALALLLSACGADSTEVPPGAGSASDSGTESTTSAVTDSGSEATSQGTDSMTGTSGASMTTMSGSDSMTGMTQGSESDSDPTATDSTGGTMGVSASSTGDDSGSTTSTMTCDDAMEPNDSEGMSMPAPDVGGCGGSASHDSTLDGAGDTDWWQFNINTNNCGDNPSVDMQSSPVVDICVYFQCNAAEHQLEVTCLQGTPATSAENRDGCCGAGDVHAGYVCNPNNSSDESARAFVEVSGAAQGQCLDYTLDYINADAELS